MGTYEFKKFTFYNPTPKAIHGLRFNPNCNKLALSRSDNTVEIWDVQCTPHIDRVLIGVKDDSIESMAWCGDRLFTAGIGGSVIEHDLLNLTVKHDIPVTSGSCWCIDVNADKTLLAAGTEDGYINIIAIHEDGLMHEKLMDKQQGRILCLAWEHSGQFLATGSLDAVRIWNLSTGHAIHKLLPGRSETNTPTVVWCIAVTSDFTIISGDSRGKITFWDGERGLHLDSHQSHKTDILALTLNKDETKLYCAGVDPLIASFEKINVRGSANTNVDNYKWIKAIQRVIHDHDVRALTMCDDKLFSGGNDGYLALSSYPPKVLIKYSPVLQSKKITLAQEARIVLITYDEHMELWHWSRKNDINNCAVVKSFKQERIRSSTISPDGTWLVYSTESVLRLLRLSMSKKSKIEIKKVSGLPEELKSVAVCCSFSPDSQYLIVASKNRKISVVRLESDETVHTVEVTMDNDVLKDTIHLISISNDCKYIVVADRSSNIAVLNNFQYRCSLPKYCCAPTAMAISCDQECVVVSYSDHKMVEFNMEKRNYTKFSKALSQKPPRQWLTRQFPVEGILFDKTNPNVIIVYDDTTIFIIDKTKKLLETKCKIPRLDAVKPSESSENSESSGSQFSLSGSEIAFHNLKQFKHLVYLSTFTGNELLAVEVSPDALIKKLPPLLVKKRNRFGTM